MGIHNGSIFSRFGLRSLLGLCLVSLLLSACAEQDEIVLERAHSQQNTQKDTEEGTGGSGTVPEEEDYLYVHVCGAVKAPGLKKLPVGSRVWDALEAAEGFTEEADEDAINLAAFVQDGEKIRFPTKEERILQESRDDRIDLNAADEETLTSLPGIGSAKAAAIVKYRREHNGFSSKEELLQVPGIHQALFEQIRELVKVKDEG